MAIEMKRAMRPSTGASQSDLRSLDIEVSENGGFAVRCRMKQPEPTKGNQMPAYVEPELQTFATLNALLAFLRTEFSR